MSPTEQLNPQINENQNVDNNSKKKENNDFYDLRVFEREFDPWVGKENEFNEMQFQENERKKADNPQISTNTHPNNSHHNNLLNNSMQNQNTVTQGNITNQGANNGNQGMFNNFYGYEMPFFDPQRENFQESGVSNTFFPMRNNGPPELFTSRPFHDLEQPLYVNAHQFNSIRKRKMRRDFLDSITVSKNSLSYLHESRHRHAMNRLRAPSGRFLTKEEAEEMRAREKQEE